MSMDSGIGRHRPPGAGGPVGLRGMSLVGSLGIVAVVAVLIGWALVTRLTGGPTLPTPPVGSTPAVAVTPSVPATGSPTQLVSTTAGPQVTLSEVVLSCTLAPGDQVTATLTFGASGPVPVTLVAGKKLMTETVSGRANLSVTGPAIPAMCSALVAGHAYGPVAAHP